MGAAPPPVRLLRVPYDSGRRDERMGAGPLALTRAGAAGILSRRGHRVTERLIEAAPGWHAELQTAFELQRLISVEVTAARAAGQVPLLLAGNCNTTSGVLAGLADPVRRLGLVWFDAHGDFNTPEIDSRGFLDGHGLAMAVGRCWRSLTSTVSGFVPLPEDRVMLVGARDLDDDEEIALRGSAITWLPPAQARDADHVRTALEVFTTRIDHVHLHIDLDVHDPSIAPANGYAAPGGMSAEEVGEFIRQIADRTPISSATLAAYDPSYDLERRMERTALDLLLLLASLIQP
jgi:arginase